MARDHLGTTNQSACAPVVVDALLDLLEAAGVDHVFGVPGGPLTSFFEALERRPSVRYVLARHEGGAAFMANAFARVRGSLAVCCVTSGPGATNALTGAAGAMRDSLPVLYLSGQVATKAFGKGAIQESTSLATDVVAAYAAATKLSLAVTSENNALSLLSHAIRTALAGRTGPVHVSLPADVARTPVVARAPADPARARLPRARPVDAAAAAAAAALLAGAQRPCLFAGHGVALAGAEGELVRVAEKLNAPVITSPKGKGVFDERHPLACGVFGLGGHARAHDTLGAHDVLLVVGSSLNEFSSSAWDPAFAAGKLVQIDIDPVELGRNFAVDVGVVGDARAALALIADALPDAPAVPAGRPAPPSPATSTPAAPVATARLHPSDVVAQIRAALPDDGMLFVDNGNAIIWGGHGFEARAPGTYFIDLGLASMGSAVAGVVGGALARPDRKAVALVGDAAFAMNGLEVHTAVELGVRAVWVVLNNGGHGMVGQGEKLLLGKDLGFGRFRTPIDCAAVARAVGARGVRVDDVAGLRAALADALAARGPTVIDALVDEDAVPPTLERRAASLARFFNLR